MDKIMYKDTYGHVLFFEKQNLFVSIKKNYQHLYSIISNYFDYFTLSLQLGQWHS